MKHVRMSLPVLAVALLLGVSGCGSSSTGSTATSQQTQQSGGQGQQPGGGQGRFPGANGTIVDVAGTTMQVQSQQADQVAVTWNDKTSFTRQAGGTVSDIKVGDCVMVTSDATGSTAPTSGSMTATSVRVSGSTNGACSIGGRGGPGGTRSGAPSRRPSGAPSGLPRGGFGGGAFGTVKSVTGSDFTVASQGFGQSTGTSTVDVATSSRTTVSRSVAATSKAVRTGLCVTARGSSDSTGAVTASSVALSPPVNGSCGGFGPGRPGGSGAASGSSRS
jgi:hypothetical protein